MPFAPRLNELLGCALRMLNLRGDIKGLSPSVIQMESKPLTIESYSLRPDLAIIVVT
jgi:hypothetical protein